ncbi:MAG: hypothetical protein JWQ20_2946 [Conexibacter sp.]|nr:hypothetical protein [Conexibacter sp.]
MVDRGFKFVSATSDHRSVTQPQLPETMSLHDPRHYVRRVVLPSGKTIEVVYFEDQQQVAATAPVAASPASSPDESVSDLHLCGSCSSTLVYPIEWEEAGVTHWEVTLRCPNCEWAGTGIFEQELVERFDEELDRGTEALVRDLKRLSHANMEDEIERFTTALDENHIVPEDF